jgi:hypothetical protein
MDSIGYGSESVGIDREAIGTGSESIRTEPGAVGTEPVPGRMGGVSVKEAAQLVGMPVSTMYDWVNRRWVRTIVGLSERGKEQRLVPWSEIERLKGGAKEMLLQQSGRKLDSGSDSETTGSDSVLIDPEPVPVGEGSPPAGTGSDVGRIQSESVGIDWKLVAKAEVRRVRDLAARIQFLEAHLARAEARAEKAEERAEREGHELRILIAQSVQAQQQTAAALSGIEERMALPGPKKAPWWRPWRR